MFVGEDREFERDEEVDFDDMDLEDKLEALLDNHEMCPRCDNRGCNYCLMLEY